MEIQESRENLSTSRPPSELSNLNPQLSWRLSLYQERMDAELAGAQPFIVDVSLDEIQVARKLEADQALASMTSEAVALAAAEIDVRDESILRSDVPHIPIRIYSPKNGRQLPGVIMFFHGGGFVFGSVNSEHARCIHLAKETQCVVVSVDYRLAPEHPFPAAFDDCYDALVWAAANAAELGVISGNIAVVGASAGGNLAAAVSLKARDCDGPPIAIQVLIYPVIDVRMKTPSILEFTDTPVWDSVRTKAMWSLYLGENQEPTAYASPALSTSFVGLPPACVIAAELDPLRDEAIEYAIGLIRAGVAVELHTYPGAYHGFDVAVPYAEISQKTLADQARAIRKAVTHFRGKNSRA
jgi:acetyl esterase